MHKDWKELTATLSTALNELRVHAPEAAKAFGAMGAAAVKDGVLDKKTKELIAVAISITARCDGCVGFHTRAAKNYGATREEMLEVIATAIYMGGGPSYVYGAQALECYDQL